MSETGQFPKEPRAGKESNRRIRAVDFRGSAGQLAVWSHGVFSCLPERLPEPEIVPAVVVLHAFAPLKAKGCIGPSNVRTTDAACRQTA